MMDLLLIQPPAAFDNSYPVLPETEVGIGMLTILAYAESFNYNGEIIHIPRAKREGFTLEDIVSRIKEANPLIVGIGLNWLHFSKGAIQVAALIKKILPNTMVVIGGQHATLFAEEILLENSEVDAITIGESEITFKKLLDKLKNGSRDFSDIKGLMVRGDNGVISSKPEIMEDLDNLPFYSYKYVWPRTKQVCAALDTVRGECIKDCSYCIESKTNSLQGRKKFTSHSQSYLARQIKVFVDEGIKNVTIQDPFTLLGDKFIQEFCIEIKKLNIRLDLLNIFVEPRVFKEETLNLLKEASDRVTFDFGMETGSVEIANIIGRSYSKPILLRELKKANDAGIKVLTWWMTALPSDTRATLRDTLDYIDETISVGAIPRWITPLILFPHTSMSKNHVDYKLKPKLVSFKDFSKYSVVNANKYGVYDELITHETENQTSREIVENTIALKKDILNKIKSNREKLLSLGWHIEELKGIEAEAEGSFY